MGQPKEALALYNEALEVDTAADIPEDVGGDNTLLLLDRSMILQQLGEYEFSSRDLQLADKQIELLDFSRSGLDTLGKYMFSDDTGPYKAPPYEKLMINTMNMVNYLVQGDLNGARIEARRLAVIQKYLRDSESPAKAMLGPGSYLAGFTFEKSGRAAEALRYYDEALQFGDYQSLRATIRRLSATSSYSSPRLKKLLDGAEAEPEGLADDDSGEIFVIVNFGRVPAKFAERIPIGLALTYASGWLSPMDRQQANKLALQGLVTWINYPELGKSRGTYDTPSFALDGRWQVLEGALAVDREARSAYEHARGAIVASAITRMISRVVAGSVAQKAAGDKGGGALGLLLNLGTQVTLTATDTPDTRSWATLPARMAFSRVRVKAGKHRVTLSTRGYKKSQSVDIKAGGFKVLALTVLE
jgi:tetratricopeptide (TPR) repeat protein